VPARPGIGLWPAIRESENLPSPAPAAAAFLRRANRRKDGQDHRSFSVVENRRLWQDGASDGPGYSRDGRPRGWPVVPFCGVDLSIACTDSWRRKCCAGLGLRKAGQALKELPQPQVERTLGFSNLKPDPSNVST